MATKVTIDGKEYCVETLLHEVKRLKRELTIQAEENKQSKIGILTELKLEIEEKSKWEGDYSFAQGELFCRDLIQEKINILRG